MSALGFIYALLVWFGAAFALSAYEVNVRVLRPSTRSWYGGFAFAAGLVLWALVAKWRR